MRKSVSPGLAVGIVVAVLLVVGMFYWAGGRTTPTTGRKPAQSAGAAMPQQPFIPKATGP